MVPLLPAWLLGTAVATRAGTRLRAMTLMLAGFLACAVPLALYKLVAAGDPLADVAKYNLLTWLAPEFTPERNHRMLTPPAPLPYLAAHPGDVFTKFVGFLPLMLRDAIGQGGVRNALFALVYLGWFGRERTSRAVWITAIAIMTTLVVLVTLSLPNVRYLFPLLPIWIVFGVVAAGRLLAQLSWSPRIKALALGVFVLLGPGLGTLQLWSKSWPHGVSDRGGFSEPEWRELGGGIVHGVPARAVVATDVGPQLAWYTERATVLIPNTPEDLATVDRQVPIDAIVLTNHWLIGTPGSAEWRDLFFANRMLAGWTRADSVTAGRLRAVVFTRSAR